MYSSPDGEVLGLDLDDEALAAARQRLTGFGDRLVARQANFAAAKAILSEIGWQSVDGIVLDLGISSHQLESQERGFSFRGEARLDMRMDRRQSLDAYEIVNAFSVAELERILRKYGEEPQARRIALAIGSERKIKAINTTEELAEIVARVKGRGRRDHHPATQTFQALRIAVNQELENLDRFLDNGLRTSSAQGPDGGYFVSFFGRSTGENCISQVEPRLYLSTKDADLSVRLEPEGQVAYEQAALSFTQ